MRVSAKLGASAKLGLLAIAAVSSITVGACFNGVDAYGLPCENDLQCGSGALCVDGFCDGVYLCGDDLTEIDALAACDGILDCPDGDDEALELCPDAEQFMCLDDSSSIPLTLACDGSEDCPDGSDEQAVCAGVGVNQCFGTDSNIHFELGPSYAGVDNPVEVLAIDIMGTPATDAIIASRDGNGVKIVFDLETDSPKEYYFDTPPPSFEGRLVKGYMAGEVNGDNRMDVVIVAGSESAGGAVYVYQSNAMGQPPSLFGTRVDLPDIGVVNPVVHGVELGRLNNDASTDIVAVVDAGPISGAIMASFGDSNAAANGGAYFDPVEIPAGPVGYSTFFDMALADVDGDNLDDVLVTGLDGNGPSLWIVLRSGDGSDVGAWDEPIKMPLAFPGAIALGRFMNSPEIDMPLGGRPDMAILDQLNGQVQTLMNGGPSMYTPGPTLTLSGQGFSGLTLGDLNCDDLADFVYNVGEPAELRVLFGDGTGGVLSPYPVAFAGDGVPMGGLGFAEFDEDETPDIISAVSSGNGLSDPQVRVLVSAQTVQ